MFNCSSFNAIGTGEASIIERNFASLAFSSFSINLRSVMFSWQTTTPRRELLQWQYFNMKAALLIGRWHGYSKLNMFSLPCQHLGNTCLSGACLIARKVD